MAHDRQGPRPPMIVLDARLSRRFQILHSRRPMMRLHLLLSDEPIMNHGRTR